MGRHVLASAVMVFAVAGCTEPATFNCQNAADCGGDGLCEPTGFCSFPDAACPSGRRYGELAGTGLASQCVDPVGTTSSGDPASETGSTTQGVDDSTTELGTTSSGSSTAAPKADSSSTSGTDESSSTGDTDAPEPMPFEDDFDRPDDVALGNGWVEKNPAIFAIAAETVRLTPGPEPVAYYDNLAYRPFEEALLDVRVEADTLFEDNPSALGAPQVYARIQPDSASPGGATAYLCFIGSSGGGLSVRRQDGVEETDFGELPTNITDESLVRFRFDVSGTDPVALTCTLFDENGAMLAQVITSDDTPERLVEPGVAGFSVHLLARGFGYDAVRVEPL